MSILPSAPVIPESDNVVPGSAMNMALATWVRVGARSPEQLATLSLVLSAADIDHLVKALTTLFAKCPISAMPASDLAAE